MQDDIFKNSEGNQWFQRNKEALILENRNTEDVVIKTIKTLALKVKKVAEVGCSNGWRLEKIRRNIMEMGGGGRIVGFDISETAIQDGRERYPKLELQQASLAEMATDEKFDLVICNFVLHWVDRKNLLASLAKIDGLIESDGIIILCDFYPDFNQKRRYHHLPEQEIYTYKQDYASIFLALGSYRQIMNYTFSHDKHDGNIAYSDSQERAVCVVLKKMRKDEFYIEV